jgi:LysR family transcriptional regulator for metE and metH
MSRSPLELRHLQTLLALSQTGSVAKAAERVFVTQSALSHQLKALESHYGVPLFERNSRPIRFTPAGNRLLSLAQDVERLTEDAERHLRRLAAGGLGELRIAVECHTCFDWLMPAMDAFRERWPDVELDLISGFHAQPQSLVANGAADFAVIHGEPAPRAGLVAAKLFSYETVAIVSPRHPLAARDYLTPDDFADQILITYPVDEAMLDVAVHFLVPAGIKPRRRNVELTVAILQLVASGRGIAALPRWSVAAYLERGYVVGKRLGESGLYCELFAAVPESAATAAYMRDFMDEVRRGARDIVQSGT